ncbi:hypothetical protein LG943_04075 [Streptomonospora sp. S1-112]|uniref:DUF4190 domain-containing protein n=1 Tax=Streptomonospora mangrovi TaxID=2883123 RepID=A0A9X3NST9_9ACTN|nr:hypothetical protein [Streptomonospora mangrovi]MDA0563511.1 hypothetical protein [Streptomonospora mangrovi]
MGGSGQPPASQGSAIGALIANVVGLCLCWPFGIIGIILGIVAVVNLNTNPSTARTCSLIAWILFGVSVVVGIAYWVLYGFAAFSAY